MLKVRNRRGLAVVQQTLRRLQDRPPPFPMCEDLPPNQRKKGFKKEAGGPCLERWYKKVTEQV